MGYSWYLGLATFVTEQILWFLCSLVFISGNERDRCLAPPFRFFESLLIMSVKVLSKGEIF